MYVCEARREKCTCDKCTLPTIPLGPAGRRPARAYDDDDDDGDGDSDSDVDGGDDDDDDHHGCRVLLRKPPLKKSKVPLKYQVSILSYSFHFLSNLNCFLSTWVTQKLEPF